MVLFRQAIYLSHSCSLNNVCVFVHQCIALLFDHSHVHFWHLPLLPLPICSPFLDPSAALIQHVHSQPDIPSLASHPSVRLPLNGISSAHYPSNTLFCQQHKVDLFTHHLTDLFHKQPKFKERGDAEMSANQSNNHSANLLAKHSSFPSVSCKAHLLEAALDAISNSIPSLNLPECFQPHFSTQKLLLWPLQLELLFNNVRVRIQGEEINKVSSQSPWPAVEVFLGLGRGVQGGGLFLSFISFADKSLTSLGGLYR